MNPTFFIFCEGKTEAAYVDLLRRSFRVPIEIIAKISDSNISQPYIDRCRRERFTTPRDKTFLMFDLDVAGMFERLSKLKDSVMLLSNPCVEYWFLLHYADVRNELSSSECLSRLKRFDPNYTKGTFSAAMQEILLSGSDTASGRAKAREAYSNPSSTIHILIDEIRGMAQ